jgi:hypothetical protein
MYGTSRVYRLLAIRLGASAVLRVVPGQLKNCVVWLGPVGLAGDYVPLRKPAKCWALEGMIILIR